QVSLNLRLTAGHIPDAHFVNLPAKPVGAAPSDQERVTCLGKRAGGIRAGLQYTVAVDAHEVSRLAENEREVVPRVGKSHRRDVGKTPAIGVVAVVPIQP